MAFTKVTDEERENLGVSGLSDTPGLETGAMQAKFDETGNRAIDGLNTLCDELTAPTAATNIGATIPQDLVGRVNANRLQDILNVIAHMAVLGGDQNTKLENIDAVSDVVVASSHIIPTGKAIYDYVLGLQGGDAYMQINEYMEDDKIKLSYLPVDSALNDSSNNPVSNTAVTTKIGEVKHALRTIKVVVPNSNSWTLDGLRNRTCTVSAPGVTPDDYFMIVGHTPSPYPETQKDLDEALSKISYATTGWDEIEFKASGEAPAFTVEVVMVGIQNPYYDNL